MLATCVWLCLVLATCDFSKVILFKGANLNIETELPTVAQAGNFSTGSTGRGIRSSRPASAPQQAGGQPGLQETVSICTPPAKEKKNN